MSLAPRARRQTVVTHRPASGSNVVKLTTEDGHPIPAPTFNSKLELGMTCSPGLPKHDRNLPGSASCSTGNQGNEGRGVWFQLAPGDYP